MPRGLSQERAQRIWDAAYAAAFIVALQDIARAGPLYAKEERAPAAADQAARQASEAVTALRERERRQPKVRR